MLPRDLLDRLAHGRPEPRAALAAALGLDRDGLAGQLAALGATGLELRETPEGHVGLAEPIVWLDPAAIHAALDDRAARRVAGIACSFELESTNRTLLAAAPPAPGRLALQLAEYQHGGRGRRGRSWSMPPGCGIALSAAWQFAQGSESLSALSLAVGVAVRRAIRNAAGIEIGLKWPNDLIVAGAKLGGILVEVEALADGAWHVVVGIGINVAVPAAHLARVGSGAGGSQPAGGSASASAAKGSGTASAAEGSGAASAAKGSGAASSAYGACDLRAAAPGQRCDRSRLAAELVNRLAELFDGFAATGFAPYRDEWQAAHVLDGAAIELHTADGVAYGTVCGIEADGALLIADPAGRRRRIVAGDVSLRAGN